MGMMILSIVNSLIILEVIIVLEVQMIQRILCN